MQKEKVYKANEILRAIKRNERSIEVLSNFVDEEVTLYDRKLFGNVLTEDNCPREIFFDLREIKDIIQSKEKLIEMLEKELEEL